MNSCDTATEPMKQSLFNELADRIARATHAVNDIAGDLHSQAERVFGPTPVDPSPPEVKTASKAPLAEDLGAVLERLDNRIAHLRSGAKRLWPIA